MDELCLWIGRLVAAATVSLTIVWIYLFIVSKFAEYVFARDRKHASAFMHWYVARIILRRRQKTFGTFYPREHIQSDPDPYRDSLEPGDDL